MFGVAIKDRAAILMSGQNANAAFWLEQNMWVTSTYYRADLPGYLRVLNDGHAFDRFRSASGNCRFRWTATTMLALTLMTGRIHLRE